MSRLSSIALVLLAAALAVAAGQSGRAHAAGPGYVSGTVYHDKDMDGEMDEGEAPLAWYHLGLTEPNNPEAAPRTTITGGDGRYRFDGLERGVNYLVTLRPDDRTLCATMPGSGGWGLGESDQPFFDRIDFGVVRKGSGRISGTIVNDLNENGVRDPGESSLEGWSLTLGNVTNDQTMYCGLEEISDADGFFAFDDLPLFAYSLAVWSPNLARDKAWEVTYVRPSGPLGTPDMILAFPKITVSSTEYARQIEVGIHFVSGSGAIRGTVFEDRNVNGVPDPGEPGIGTSPSIWLWRLVDGELLGMENWPYPMKPDGTFEITGLPAGTYYLVIAGRDFNTNVPSDANGFPYHWVILADGQVVEGVDFPWAPPASETATPQPPSPTASTTAELHAPIVGTDGARSDRAVLPTALLLAAGVVTLGSGVALARHSRR